MTDSGLTREEIDKIITDVAADQERQRKAQGYRNCSCCGAPLGARFDVPTECSECLKSMDLPEFLRGSADDNRPDED